MDQDRWKEVNRIFHAALEMAPSERRSFVLTASGGDHNLQVEVEALLRADEDAGSYLEHPFLSSQTETIDEDPLHPGDVVGGRFRILREIAKGGMGQVFEAFDSELNVHVALKILRPQIASDSNALARFRQEVKLARSINHSHVCRTFDIERASVTNRHGTTREVTFLTMEFLPGETLASRIRKSGALPSDLAAELARQLASAIDAAHSHGIIHRDLKPGNIMLVPPRSQDSHNGLPAVITDFGLARVVSISSEPESTAISQCQGWPVGTIAYMSPEQLAGTPVMPATDIYSFGLILFEIVTGRQAFPSESFPEGISQRLAGLAPRVQECLPNLSQQWAAAIEWCLRSNAGDRPPSASEALAVIEGEREPSTEAPSQNHQTSSARLRYRRLGLAGTAIGVLALALLITWWRIPTPVPVVESITQLTDDREPKFQSMVSDGSRIYFNEGKLGHYSLAQVAIAGGPTAPVETRFANSNVVGISSDGSALIVMVPSNPDPDAPGSLWSIPLPTGEPRLLINSGVRIAALLPDGRIVFATCDEGKDPQGTDSRTDWFIAGNDGTNRHKLVSLPDFWGEVSVSPDGRRILISQVVSEHSEQLYEIGVDGTGLREIRKVKFSDDECCFAWSPDEKSLIYQSGPGMWRGIQSDIWVLPLRAGLFQRPGKPIQLTNGPLFYSAAHLSRDGKKIFVTGTKRRGELVRYDMSLRAFVPFLSGISATDATFSQDGKWVAYASYPDGNLWRSRSDGSERIQLTFPPVAPSFPQISPDGTKVAFFADQPEGFDLCVVSMEGGAPRVIDHRSLLASWSPDGSYLFDSVWSPSGPLQIIDVRSGKKSAIPVSKYTGSGFWLTQDVLVVRNPENTNFRTFNLKTKKWADLSLGGLGDIENWMISPDRKYLYYAIRGPEPKAMRIRVADHHVETITSLKDLRRVVNNGFTQINVAPDGSPIFTRDVGYDELFALNVRWP